LFFILAANLYSDDMVLLFHLMFSRWVPPIDFTCQFTLD
jgi:hypothetical protein